MQNLDKKVSAKIYPWAMFVLIIVQISIALYLLTLGFLLAKGAKLHLTSGSYDTFDLETDTALLLLTVAACWSYIRLLRLPYMTCVDRAKITTYSPLGKRTLQLDQVRKVSTFLVFPPLRATDGLYLIRLSLNSGKSVYIHLHFVPKSMRTQILQVISQGIQKSPIKVVRKSAKVRLKTWYSYRNAPKDKFLLG